MTKKPKSKAHVSVTGDDTMDAILYRVRARSIGPIHHPLLHAIGDGHLSQEQLKQFCALRYTAAAQFEPLIEHTMKMAEAKGMTHLAAALHRNLCDERGLNYDTGAPVPGAAHSSWRKDFLDALGVQKSDAPPPHVLYDFQKEDHIGLLVGMLIGAELAIPYEDKQVLKGLRKAFPGVFPPAGQKGTPEQEKAALYLVDHIKHDTQRHLPELIDAIKKDMPDYISTIGMDYGVKIFCQERIKLMDYVQKELGVENPASAKLWALSNLKSTPETQLPESEAAFIKRTYFRI